MTDVIIFSRYNLPGDSGIDFHGVSMTQRHFKDECDINKIVERYVKTGLIETGSRMPVFEDFSCVGDFRDMQLMLLDAQESFDSLPAAVRDRFNNDPGRLIEFVLDEANRDEAIKLGLVEASEQGLLDVTVPTDTKPKDGVLDD